MAIHDFSSRHIGPRKQDVKDMLSLVGVSSLDELVDQTIPPSIRLKENLNLPESLSEAEYTTELKTKARKNKVFRSYIGLGYYNTHLPSVIRRNILENPGWYTAYTPYQAEISQGRLEALLNFQTMVMDLTGMELANSSLLDEGTAAAEAMSMAFDNRSREAKKNNVNKFFVSEKCFPQTIDVLKTRSAPLDIELVIGDHEKVELDSGFFGALIQYPDMDGEINDYRQFADMVHKHDALLVVAADILSLTLLTPPGEWGADVVVGTTQRFGIPLGYGGPHAAYFATKEEYKRSLPGRIIGVSVDRYGNKALRMALQTREQHIKRARATSNICTAQVLLAVMAGMYAAYHGKEGLVAIAEQLHANTSTLAGLLGSLGHKVKNDHFFDTITIDLTNVGQKELQKEALKAGMNFRYNNDGTVSISLDETTDSGDLNAIVGVFESASGKRVQSSTEVESRLPEAMLRESNFLTHPVFNTYHSETEMMRYMKKLENRDISLTHSMIPLGSCTMKLNAATELFPLTWPEFSDIHPFVPQDQAEGYKEVIDELEEQLCAITGFDAISMQPNSGAQGEYAGLMVIKAYHEDRGEPHRNVVLIPSSAHGTNPASAVMAGMKVVVVKCDDHGNIDLDDLHKKAEKHGEKLAALMVTYPSTHGVFEEHIMEVTETIHKHGGQVYMDGANMNAQVGLTNPAIVGADVCHLNLHKTFAIPHGGGGPGMGPIGVVEHLKPYLPSNPVVATGGEKSIPAISAAPWGSALILLISYGYIKMLGAEGLKASTQLAILNANYIKARLKGNFETLYANEKNRVAHEMIMECRGFKKETGIDVLDIAKRLIDYGFHAPTVSFPVNGTMMIEPTESESKEELDRFSEALISIKEEIDAVKSGQSDPEDNVLKNAPHTAEELCGDEWKHPYSREKAAFPLPWVRDKKYWTGVGRVNDAFGDRNLICSCPPIENYEEEVVV